MKIIFHHHNYLFVKDIITFIFTVIGLVIAGLGLATWKKQIKGSKEFDTAYNLHYSILKLREAIKHVRNPMIWPSESRRAVEFSKNKYPDKSAEEIEKNSHSFVYEMRWEKIIAVSTEMESHLLAAEVIWGSEILTLIKPLNQKIVELNIDLQQYFQPDLRTKDLAKIREIVYDGSSPVEKDNFSKKVDEIIDEITNYIKGKIS